MDEKEFNESTEIDLEAIHNRMFDENTATLDKDENMNREYLKRVHNGADMSFLPKEVRLTRTQYYKMVDGVEKEAEAEINRGKKQIKSVTVVFLCIMLFVALFYGIGDAYDRGAAEIEASYKTELNENIDTDLNSADDVDRLLNPKLDAGDKEAKDAIKAYNIAGGVVRAVGWLIFCGDLTMFLFFFISSYKIIHKQKQRREISLKRLEALKQEHMLLGTYDAEY